MTRKGITARKVLAELIDAMKWLYIHGLLTDGERRRVERRLDKLAARHGLQIQSNRV